MKKNTKKILYVSNTDQSHHLFNMPIMLAMKEKGYKVVAVANGEKYIKEIKSKGVKFIKWHLLKGNINPFKEIRAFNELYRIIKKERPDIIHSSTIKANIYSVIIGKRFGIKVIVGVIGLGYIFTDNELRSLPLRSIAQPIVKRYWKKADKIIVLNSDDLRFVSKSVPNKVIKISGSGVDHVHFCDNLSEEDKKNIQKELGIRKEEIIVTCVARLLKHKGIMDLACAAEIISKKIKLPIHFLVVGEEDRENPSALSRKEIRYISKIPNVTLLGFRNNIKEILSVTNIFVLASHREGCPKSILEAMAMAKPIITTTAPGCTDLVVNGKNGIKVPIESPKRLSQAILKLVKNKSLQKKMGKASREEVFYNHTYEIMCKEIFQAYFDESK